MARISRFALHCEVWQNGCGSDECELATNRVLYRGQIPCDVLFMGEAPGESEDSLGAPFLGPAGKLLDRIIAKALPEEVRRGFTNVVGCLPRLEDGAKDRKPKDAQVRRCSPRLIEAVSLAQPKLIVAVGGFARDTIDEKRHGGVKLPTRCPGCGELQQVNDKGYTCPYGHQYGRKQRGTPIPQMHIEHPAHILRQNVAQQDYSEQRCVVQLIQGLEEFLITNEERDRRIADADDCPF